MRDLAPNIFRQRLIIEGKTENPLLKNHIEDYLSELSRVLKMNMLGKPVTHKSPKYGWAGWVHWEDSGSHLYVWDDPFNFFSVDIYTCRKFSAKTATEFTKNFFGVNKIVYKHV